MASSALIFFRFFFVICVFRACRFLLDYLSVVFFISVGHACSSPCFSYLGLVLPKVSVRIDPFLKLLCWSDDPKDSKDIAEL